MKVKYIFNVSEENINEGLENNGGHKIRSISVSNGIAFIRGLFFGGFGAHRFYVDKNKSALWMFSIQTFCYLMIIISLCVSSYGSANDLAIKIGSCILIFGLSIWVLLHILVFVDLFNLSKWIEKYNLKLIDNFSTLH